MKGYIFILIPMPQLLTQLSDIDGGGHFVTVGVKRSHEAVQRLLSHTAVGLGLQQFAKRFKLAQKSLFTACGRSEEHTSELQSRGHLVCSLLHVNKNGEDKHEC